MVLQLQGQALLSRESFGDIFLCLMLVPYLRYVLFAQLVKQLDHYSRKHCTSSVDSKGSLKLLLL